MLEAEHGALVSAAPVTAEADYLLGQRIGQARLRTRRVLTFDERHFRAVRPLQGGAFELLPER